MNKLGGTTRHPAHLTQAMAFEALKVDVGRQAAEGPNDGGDGRLVLLGLHGVEELLELKSVKLVLQTTLPVLPAITRQPEFRWFVRARGSS